MTEISRAALFGKLNPLAYKAIEGATVFCKLRGNPYVELVHWLHQILQLQDSRPAPHRPALRARRRARWPRDITAALDRLPRGATSISDLSPHVEEAVERGWVYAHADVRRGAGAHRAPAVGMLKTPTLRNALLRDLAASSTRSRPTTLADELRRDRRAARPRTALTRQRRLGAAAPRPARRAARWRRPQMGKQEALKQFTVDLTEQAREGRDRPDRRPRRRDPPDRRHPDAPPPEQPDPHRRGRRRQDRGGRGLRAAHRRAATCRRMLKDVHAAHARRRPAAGRRQHEGRVREAAAPGDRRGAGLAEADHPVHRRGAHADRRGRRGRHRRRGQPAQARAGARHAAHHRAPPPGPNTRSTSRRIRR